MRHLILLLLIVVFTGCGLGLQATGDFIDSFTIQTYTTDTNNNASLSPNKNEGQFFIEWELKEDDLYDVSLYFENNEFTVLKNHPVYSVECDIDDDHPFCDLSVSVECNIGVELNINCDEAGIENFNPATILGKLPKTGYFLLEVCSQTTNQCDRATKATTFYRDQLITQVIGP